MGDHVAAVSERPRRPGVSFVAIALGLVAAGVLALVKIVADLLGINGGLALVGPSAVAFAVGFLSRDRAPWAAVVAFLPAAALYVALLTASQLLLRAVTPEGELVFGPAVYGYALGHGVVVAIVTLAIGGFVTAMSPRMWRRA